MRKGFYNSGRKWGERLVPLAGLAAVILLLVIAGNSSASATPLICDSKADFALGAEDYPEAIRLHQEFLKQHPGDALAHYHLGYAYGMTHDEQAELREYLRAEELGLRNWDLFLNLGLLRLEQGEFAGAIAALKASTRIGPDHPEAHFNLGLAYERAGMFAQALEELSTSLKLDPREPDAENELAAVYAEMGQRETAREIWISILRKDPGYQPASSNLAILRADIAAQDGVAFLNSAGLRRDP